MKTSVKNIIFNDNDIRPQRVSFSAESKEWATAAREANFSSTFPSYVRLRSMYINGVVFDVDIVMIRNYTTSSNHA